MDHTEAPNDNAPPPEFKPGSDSPEDGGWSDLPSDAEDTFFLTPEETADLHRTKRLRHFDALRTARLRALSPDATDIDGEGVNVDPWGGSDEEVGNNCKSLSSSSHIKRALSCARSRVLV